MPLADTLLRAADRALFDFLWTADIMREMRETMLRQGFLPDAVDRRIAAMQRAFRDTEVTGYEAQMSQIRLPDADDRHVLAAVIVTANLKDFPSDILAEHTMGALTPADFLVDLIGESPRVLLAIVREQAAAMRRPPMTFEALIDKLSAYAPAFAALLRYLDARERPAPDQAAVSDSPDDEITVRDT